jgi:hypothetical protein
MGRFFNGTTRIEELDQWICTVMDQSITTSTGLPSLNNSNVEPHAVTVGKREHTDILPSMIHGSVLLPHRSTRTISFRRLV